MAKVDSTEVGKSKVSSQSKLSQGLATVDNEPEENRLLNHFQGCLLGLAVGDVLGCPLEAMHPDRIKERFGRVNGLVSLSPKDVTNIYYWRRSGLHSDDTQQALTISDVLIEAGELDEVLLLDKWKEMSLVQIWIENPATGETRRARESFGCHRGTGKGFRQRIKAFNEPAPPSYADGAAMRVAPLGLFYHDASDARIDAALRSALATHSHPHAVASAAAITAAVAHALRNQTQQKKAFLEQIINETTTAEERLKAKYAHALWGGGHGVSEGKGVRDNTPGLVGQFSSTLAKLPGWLELPLEGALESIARNAEQCLGLAGLFATKSTAITAVVTAILIAVRHLDDYQQAVIEAINLGGDTDTIGAMVGAIVGAHLGVDSIPSDWQESVIAREQILLRAEGLLTGKKGSGWLDLQKYESELTQQECQLRRE